MKIRGKPALFMSVVLLVLTGLFALDIGDQRLLMTLALITLGASAYVYFRPDDFK
jgi:hypothetical protein